MIALDLEEIKRQERLECTNYSSWEREKPLRLKPRTRKAFDHIVKSPSSSKSVIQ